MAATSQLLTGLSPLVCKSIAKASKVRIPSPGTTCAKGPLICGNVVRRPTSYQVGVFKRCCVGDPLGRGSQAQQVSQFRRQTRRHGSPSQTTTRRCHPSKGPRSAGLATDERRQPPSHLVSVPVLFVDVRLGSGNVAAGVLITRRTPIEAPERRFAASH